MRLLILLILVGCQSPTARVFNGERCQTFFKIDDARRIILEESVCRCTDYQISMALIGNITETVTRHPIEYCQGFIGYSVKQNKSLVDFYYNVKDDINSKPKKKNEKN